MKSAAPFLLLLLAELFTIQLLTFGPHPVPIWVAILALPVLLCVGLSITGAIILHDIREEENRVRKERDNRKLVYPPGERESK